MKVTSNFVFSNTMTLSLRFKQQMSVNFQHYFKGLKIKKWPFFFVWGGQNNFDWCRARWSNLLTRPEFSVAPIVGTKDEFSLLRKKRALFAHFNVCDELFAFDENLSKTISSTGSFRIKQNCYWPRWIEQSLKEFWSTQYLNDLSQIME